jgi:hypothetical protein
MTAEDASEGLYGPATGALAHKRIEWNERKAELWQDFQDHHRTAGESLYG